MTPVIQEEPTGCGIASAAAIAGVTYLRAKAVAKGLSISASDPLLWSDTRHVRRLLKHFGIKTSSRKRAFGHWDSLPGLALLAIKWRQEKGRPFWHWVVFFRESDQACVLDSNRALTSQVRTDFGRMHPKWYLEVQRPAARRRRVPLAGAST